MTRTRLLVVTADTSLDEIHEAITHLTACEKAAPENLRDTWTRAIDQMWEARAELLARVEV